MSRRMNPQKSLRSKVLTTALRTFVVPPLSKRYQIVAVRTLWSYDQLDSDVNIWEKRRQLVAILFDINEVVAYISCITALQQEKKRKKRKHPSDSDEETEPEEEVGEYIYPGIAFWIVFDWPEFANEDLEQKISEKFLSAGLHIEECKVVRSRGTTFFANKNTNA